MGKISDIIINIKTPTTPDLSVVRKEPQSIPLQAMLTEAMAKALPSVPPEQWHDSPDANLDVTDLFPFDPDLIRRMAIAQQLSYEEVRRQVQLVLMHSAWEDEYLSRPLVPDRLAGDTIEAMQERRRHQWLDRSKRRRKR